MRIFVKLLDKKYLEKTITIKLKISAIQLCFIFKHFRT